MIWHLFVAPIILAFLIFFKVYETFKGKPWWMWKHSDSLFGKPDENCWWRRSEQSADGTFISGGSLDYPAVPFPDVYSGHIKVTVDRFPFDAQKEQFLWIQEKIGAIAKLVPDLLLHSSKDDPEEGNYFYGATSAEEAAQAFDPHGIDSIELSGENPVRWKIGFNAAIQQDVRGEIAGEDEIVRWAYLYM